MTRHNHCHSNFDSDSDFAPFDECSPRSPQVTRQRPRGDIPIPPAVPHKPPTQSGAAKRRTRNKFRSNSDEQTCMSRVEDTSVSSVRDRAKFLEGRLAGGSIPSSATCAQVDQLADRFRSPLVHSQSEGSNLTNKVRSRSIVSRPPPLPAKPPKLRARRSESHHPTQYNPQTRSTPRPPAVPQHPFRIQSSGSIQDESWDSSSRNEESEGSTDSTRSPPDDPFRNEGPSLPQRLPYSLLDILDSLLGQHWYHGRIPRDEAENRILRFPKRMDGTFLVRERRECPPDRPLALTLFHSSKFYHLEIRRSYSTGLFAVGRQEKPMEDTFQSVPEMVNFYRQNEIYLMSRNSECLSCATILTLVCPKPF